MINVTFFKDSSNQFVGFESKGHAGADEAGKDVVCAAVSVLVINTLNSIEAFTDDEFFYDIDLEELGYVHLQFDTESNELSNESKLLLNSLYLGIQGVEKNNEQYITLNIKEV